MVKIEIDVAHDCPVAEFLSFLERHGSPVIHSYRYEGPAGGNPCFELILENRAQAIDFLRDWHQDEDDEFLASNVTEL
jgi:hypothetical protein